MRFAVLSSVFPEMQFIWLKFALKLSQLLFQQGQFPNAENLPVAIMVPL